MLADIVHAYGMHSILEVIQYIADVSIQANEHLSG